MIAFEQHIISIIVFINGLWLAYFMNQMDKFILNNLECDIFVNKVNDLINDPKFFEQWSKKDL